MPALLTQKRFYLIAGIFAFAALAGIFLADEGIPGHLELKARLSAHLAMTGPGFGPKGPRDSAKMIIYVLGGSEKSLQPRLRTAAALYRAGRVRKLLFLAAPGITRFDPALGRNLTNKEWMVRELQALGVPPESTEALRLRQPAWFGTRAEARALALRAGEMDCRSVVLVTSAYHGRRTWRAFTDAFAAAPGTSLALALTEEQGSLRQLLFEYGKLLFYTTALLPGPAA